MLQRFILPRADVGSGIKPPSGAQLFFYEPGTSEFKDTFADVNGIFPNTNPVIADSTGVFDSIYLAGVYKVILQDKNGSQIWEEAAVQYDYSFDSASEAALIEFGEDGAEAIDQFEEDAAAAIAAAGYAIVGDFADVTKVPIEAPNQVYTSTSLVDFEGFVWRYIGVTFPYTPTGSDPNIPPEQGLWEAVAIGELETVAISLNELAENVGYDSAGLLVKEYIRAASQQKTYSVPADAIGKTIVSVVGNVLNTTVDGPYDLIEASTENAIVSIKTLGVTGDGVTPEAAAVRSAIISVCGAGGTLDFGDGEYNLSGFVTITEPINVHIIGNGASIFGSDNADLTGERIFENVDGNIIIDGLNVRDMARLISEGPANVQDTLKVANCQFLNMARPISESSASAGGYKNIEITDNIATDIGDSCFLLAYKTMTNTVITGNIIDGVGGANQVATSISAIFIGLDSSPGGRDNAVISDNIITNMVSSQPYPTGENVGIMIHDCKNYTITGNVLSTITGGAAEGIYTRNDTGYGTVDGNTLRDVIGTAISVKGGSSIISNNRIIGRTLLIEQGIGQIEGNNHLITGNWVSGCQCAIRSFQTITDSSYYKTDIVGNHVEDCRRVGIIMFATTRAGSIQGNTVRDITGGPDTFFDSQGFIDTDINAGIHYSTNSGLGGNIVVSNNVVTEVSGQVVDGVREGVAINLSAAVSVNNFNVKNNHLETCDVAFRVNTTSDSTPKYFSNTLGSFIVGVYSSTLTITATGSILQELDGGMSFPVLDVTSTSNQISNYQEGTWTPSLGRTSTFGTWVPTAVVNGGFYTRTGNQVSFSARVQGSSTGSAGGLWVVRGLPFTTSVDAAKGRAATVCYSVTAGVLRTSRTVENSNDNFIETATEGNNEIYLSGTYFIN